MNTLICNGCAFEFIDVLFSYHASVPTVGAACVYEATDTWTKLFSAYWVQNLHSLIIIITWSVADYLYH